MSGPPHLSNPRKSRPLEQCPLQQEETSQPQSKKRRLGHHSSGYQPAFWDSLSKVWLTRSALKEFDRRNLQLVPNPPPLYRQAHRPVTRHFLADLKPTEAACEFLHYFTPETLKDIKLFARHGGPDLSDLTGYPGPINPPDHIINSSLKRPSTSTSSSRPATTNTTATTNTMNSRPKDANYQQILIQNGVFPVGRRPHGQEPPLPFNWDEIGQRLLQHRPSLSSSAISEEEHKEFVRAEQEAFNEDDVKGSVFPAMLKAMGASDGAKKNILFTNIVPMAKGIALAKPDYYYGAQPEQIHQDVRDQLSKDIIPSKHTHLPAVPNFFLEAKGPDGSLAVAQRQALHDGAIGARAMQSIQSYGQEEPVCDNNAYTITSIYHGGVLKMYGHSVAQPQGPGGRSEYYMHQLGLFAMTHTLDSFRQGATAFKNAMDLTREYRNAAIVRANEMVAQIIENEDESETSVDDDQTNQSSWLNWF